LEASSLLRLVPLTDPRAGIAVISRVGLFTVGSDGAVLDRWRSLGASAPLTPSLADACLKGEPVTKLEIIGMVTAASPRGRQPIRSARDTMIPSGPRT
jgi:hypothetical protein